MIDILQATRLDPTYTKLLHAIHTNEWKNTDLRDFYNVQTTLNTKLECGQFYTVMDNRIVVPQAFHCHIFQLAHRGHPGIVRMKCKLRSLYWWPAMDTAAENHVHHCIACQVSSKSAWRSNVSSSWGLTCIGCCCYAAGRICRGQVGWRLLDLYVHLLLILKLLCLSENWICKLHTWSRECCS